MCSRQSRTKWNRAKQRDICLRRHPLGRCRWRIIAHAIDQADGLQNHVAADFQTLYAQLVHRILNGVVKAIVVAVVDIDDIEARHAGAGKRIWSSSTAVVEAKKCD